MKKIIFLACLVVAFLALRSAGFDEYLSLTFLKENIDRLQIYVQQNLAPSILAYFVGYVLVTALSLPGAAIMTLAGGAVFGLLLGTLIVSFASSLGATLAFLISRYFFRGWVKKKFSKWMERIDEGLKRDGPLYLFSIRMIAVFPFFLVNLVMGLTSIRVWTFYWVSQVGMLIGTLAYVNAGTQLAQISQLSDVLTPSILGALALLGVLPLLSKWILSLIKARKIYAPYKKPKKFDYNIVVIGGGSAGLVTSYIAAAVKAKVALIEKHKMGGDCLNTGCVPSKALIKSAKVAQSTRKLDKYGLKGASAEIDFAQVMERVSGVIKKIEPHDSIERYSGLGVDCIQANAKITSPYTIAADGREISARSIVVATGARPLVPPIPGLKEAPYYTSDTIWQLREKPQRLLVLGGGPIGCELAQSFGRLGCEVTQVEMAPQLMGREDPEVSQFVEKIFSQEGIRVLTSHKATEFKKIDGQPILVCEGPKGAVEIKFDAVLVALGRAANSKGFGLEELGVELNRNGTIAHDAFMRTRYPNIFVCGDVAGPYQFTHTAGHQAWFAAVNSLFSPLANFKVDYRVIPWCTFVDPEVARVGINESEAKAQNIDYDVVTYNLDDLDRSIAESEDYGFVKVITPKGKDTILGATIVGSHAGEMIPEFVLAMKHKLGLNKILSTIHIYPTHSEANKYAAGLWKKKNAPEKLLSYVEKFHSWRRS